MTDYDDNGEAIEHLPAQTQGAQLPAKVESRAVFNPLDASPAAFRHALAERKENYVSLAEHLRGMLVPYKDFGRIHVAKDCKDKYSCANPYHYSGDTLFAPGADKILSSLGLSCEYPGEDDYRRASLKGIEIKEVILKAFIMDLHGRTIAQGTAAASTKEHQGSLHNTIQKAEKRARLDAVKRLPGVSSLFEDGTLSTVGGGQSTAAGQAAVKEATRTRATGPSYATGAALTSMPFGKFKGKPWRELEDSYLEWAARREDSPDVAKAATAEIERRALEVDDFDMDSVPPPPDAPPPRSPAPQRQAPPATRAAPPPPRTEGFNVSDLEEDDFKQTRIQDPDDEGLPPLEAYL